MKKFEDSMAMRASCSPEEVLVREREITASFAIELTKSLSRRERGLLINSSKQQFHILAMLEEYHGNRMELVLFGTAGKPGPFEKYPFRKFYRDS